MQDTMSNIEDKTSIEVCTHFEIFSLTQFWKERKSRKSKTNN